MAFAQPTPSSRPSPESRRALGLLLVLLALATLLAAVRVPVEVAAGAALGATFIVYAFWTPRAAFMVLLVYAEVLSGFLKILASGSATAAAVADVMAVVVLVAALVRYGLPSLRTSLDKLIFAYLLLVPLLAVLNPGAPGGVQLIGGVRTLVLYLPFYFLARSLMPSLRHERRMVALLLAGAALLGCVSAVQYVMGATWSQHHHLASRVVLDYAATAGGYRPSSLFPLPGVAGMFFAAMLVVNVVVLMRPDGRSLRLYALTLLPIGFGLMASGQRAAMLGCGCAMLVLAWVGRSQALVGVVLISGSLALAVSVVGGGHSPVARVSAGVSGSSTHSTETRFHTWTSVARQLPSYPFGHGPGYTGSSAFRFGSRTGVNHRITSDNYWVKELWEMGLLGALWYTAFLVLAFLTALRLLRNRVAGFDEAMLLTVLGLIAQQVGASWFTNSLDPSPYNLIFWSMLGLIHAPALLTTPAPRRRPAL